MVFYGEQAGDQTAAAKLVKKQADAVPVDQ